MSELSIIVYTNESYLDLLELTIPSVFKSFEHLNPKFYLISNKFTAKLNYENFTIIDCGVEFSSDGSHFQKTMSQSLELIDSELILLLCDDYYFKSPTKKEVFNNLIEIMIDYNIDYLSLGTQKHMENYIYGWKKLSSVAGNHNKILDEIYFMDKNYRHLYSVQPCIWKKRSLQNILANNKNLTLHDLDNTNIKDSNGLRRLLDKEKNYMFYTPDDNFKFYTNKNICLHKPPLTYHVDEKLIDSDYFVIDYIEIIRHGKFITSDVNSKKILTDILLKNKTLSNKLSKFN